MGGKEGETAGRGRSLGKPDFDGKGVGEANASEGGGVTGCCSCGWRETRVFVPRSKGKKGSRKKGAESPPEPAKSVSKSKGVGGRARGWPWTGAGRFFPETAEK